MFPLWPQLYIGGIVNIGGRQVSRPPIHNLKLYFYGKGCQNWSETSDGELTDYACNIDCITPGSQPDQPIRCEKYFNNSKFLKELIIEEGPGTYIIFCMCKYYIR